MTHLVPPPPPAPPMTPYDEKRALLENHYLPLSTRLFAVATLFMNGANDEVAIKIITDAAAKLRSHNF
jgi:hypothetical protein